jgi:cAMP-dependent protein kinase regulator
MTEWLQKKGGYTSNGLTIEEKKELTTLRATIKNYRELESNTCNTENDDAQSQHSADDTESDDEPIVIDLNKAKARLSVPRAAVSAEPHNPEVKNANFTPKIIPKSEDQIQRIKSRILQSLIFNHLEAHDLQIVIDSMEENTFNKGEHVIQQGEAGDCLYVVEIGELNCFKKFVR